MEKILNKTSKLDVANNSKDREEAVKQLLKTSTTIEEPQDPMVRLSVDVKKSTRNTLKKYVVDHKEFKTIGALVEHLIEEHLGIRKNVNK